jgi:hypothetical protein
LQWKYSGDNGLFENRGASETIRVCQAPIRIHKMLLSTVKAPEKVNTLTNFDQNNKFPAYQVDDRHQHGTGPAPTCHWPRIIKVLGRHQQETPAR